MTTIEIETIDTKSPYLSSVKQLWRANSAVLGYLPDGAFEEYAQKRCILVAVDGQKECMGYLLYRRSRERITIVHLCISESFRGKGVGRKLVNELSANTKEFRGIGLRCRRDFDASKAWPRLGFTARRDLPGRARNGSELTSWWLDHNLPDLFSIAAEQRLQSKLNVVIDANIFFDLASNETIGKEESKSLVADWLQDDLELCVTDEIYNEIDRNKDRQARNANRAFANGFSTMPCPKERVETVHSSLKGFFTKRMKISDDSDVRQLARAIASDAPFFVTRDDPLLDMSDNIYQAFGISIIRPSELIMHLEELHEATKYQPVRFSGTLLRKNLVQTGQEDSLAKQFQCSDRGENKSGFLRQLRRFLSDPRTFECHVVTDAQDNYLALFVYGRQKSHELHIPLLRITRRSLGPTIARHLISRSVLCSSQENRIGTRIDDPFLTEVVTEALREGGFIATSDSWLKVNLAVAETSFQVSGQLARLASEYGEEYNFCGAISEALSENRMSTDPEGCMRLERMLWPAKLIDADIPTFVVPIKPAWAHDLFDESLANQTLFGARADLALNSEAVYYRSKHRSGLKAPGRILWYVSGNRRYTGSGHIRACSRLDAIIIDKPQPLFQRFRRLGAYDWPRMLEVAHRDPSKEIMAIRFSGTELLPFPIPWNDSQQVLSKFGVSSQFQSPVRITNEVFSSLYRLGFNKT